MSSSRVRGSERDGSGPEEVAVRSLADDDIANLFSLDREVFGDLGYPYFVLRQLVDLHYPYWLIAARDGVLLGYSLGVPAADRSTGWLLGLGVLPAFRRRGLGARLANYSLEKLHSSGVRTVRLTVAPQNLTAVKLYRELGFVKQEIRKDYLGPGEDRILMAKALNPRIFFC